MKEIAKEAKTTTNFVQRLKSSLGKTKVNNKRLSDEKVRQIRQELKKSGISQKEIAKKFNVSQEAVSNIFRGVSYKGVKNTAEEQDEFYIKKHQKRVENSSIKHPSGCWIWQLSKDASYGISTLKGKTLFAHVLSWRFYKNNGNPVPESKKVRHLCPVLIPFCVNPSHLDIGTLEENANDRKVHGTALVSEKNPSYKYSTELVLLVREKLLNYSLLDVCKELKNSHDLTYKQVRSIKMRIKKEDEKLKVS